MGDILKMSSKERRSLIELSRVKDGQQTLIEAAKRLEFTYRHVRRVNKRFQQEGEQGLIHRGRGRGSNRSFPEAFRQECLELDPSRKGTFSAGQAHWREARSPSTLMSHCKTSRTPGLFGEGRAIRPSDVWFWSDLGATFEAC